MRRTVCGILAHVDSGKTTLSEGILYRTGAIRKLGRVDKGDSYLDTNRIERERGITIFSHEAHVMLGDMSVTLLDTPGHVDFSAETERTLSVLDYAILVISGTEMVQSHTETLWELLRKYKIPTFIFINKMDRPDTDKRVLMNNLRAKLSENCTDFLSEELFDSLAMCSEDMMEEYLQSGAISDELISLNIRRRRVFPCIFGSALKLSGIDELLDIFSKYAVTREGRRDFAARVFKISNDDRGNRLTHMKITGGTLNVRDTIGKYGEKVTDIRIYSGEKYKSVKTAYCGDICAVTGLSKTYASEGLGDEIAGYEMSREPIFSYKVKLLSDISPLDALACFKRLEEEETELHIEWNEHFKEIRLQLMGEVQLEVIKSIIKERFSIDAEFEQGSIIYHETIKNAVEGVGHYEPLRHYAEVHLLLEPLPRGSGLVFRADCREEVLEKNWQRLIMTHLREKTHLGVLTGSPITDMAITLVSGRAHLKHTEGGDFRQATYRAVRQGLMKAESVLLEPYYDFKIELPSQCLGRAMTDIEKMGGRFDPPQLSEGDTATLIGSAPISQMHGYGSILTSYTRGTGILSCRAGGYDECRNTDEVTANIGYDPEADIYNSPDSVFCAHGAGYAVKWNEVEEHMHLDAADEKKTAVHSGRGGGAMNYEIDEDELLKIFERTYGKVRRKTVKPMRAVREAVKHKKRPAQKSGKQYLLVDGYNIIFAWEDLKELANSELEAARNALAERMEAYAVMRQCEVIIVFDAYRVRGNRGEIEKIKNITVVYTKEAETADSYIERATHELSKNHRVRVATSDRLEQLIILGNGALRMSAAELLDDVEAAEDEIRRLIEENNANIN